MRIHRHSPPVRHATGFSFVDLVMSVLIIGILAAVAVPRYAESLDVYRVDGAVKRIEKDLQAAQSAARSGSKSVTVTFTVGSNQYELVGEKHPAHPSQPYIVQLANTGYPVTLTTASFNGLSQITFDMYGTPYAGAGTTTPLTSSTIGVQSGNKLRTVVIELTTGVITLP